MYEEWNTKEFGQNICRSLLAGFTVTHLLLPNIIRFLILSGLIAIFAVVDPKKWVLWHYFIFAGSVAIFLFLIQIILFILNKLLDESFELSTSSMEDIGDIERPEGISKALWNLRGAYRFDQQNVSDTSFELIQTGFPPNEVLLLVEEMKKALKNNQVSKLSKKAKTNDNQGYLSICGNLHEFPLSRKMINSVFPQNQTLITIFAGLILSFTASFTTAYSFKYLDSVVWAYFATGFSLYSILHYPDVDPYSHIKANPSSGLSRPFFISLMFTILILSQKIIDWAGPEIKLNDFNITINWLEVASHIKSFVTYAVAIIYLWIFGFIGPADSSATWIFEFLSRYAFGLSGSAGFLHSIFQFLRSLLVCIAIYFTNREAMFKYKEPTILCISSFFLQIPLNYSNMTPKGILVVFGQIIIYSLYYFLISYILSTTSMNYNIIFIICIALHTVGNIGLSSIKVFTKYTYIFARLLKFQQTGFIYFRLVLNLIVTPLLISTVLRNQCSNLLYVLVIVSGINRSISDSISFSQGLLCFVFLHYEVQMESIPAAFFLGLVIAKKLFNIIDATQLYKIARAFVLQLIIDDDDEYEKFYGILSYTLPFIDRGPPCFVGYLWSVISGSPVHSPFGITLLQFPMPPRPNSFWQTFAETKLDILKTIENNITTYPQEAPIYTSIVKALSRKLGTIIMEGFLGRVSENSFFIFYGSKMSFFLHIIAFEPHVVRFQIRGLEYKFETYCHEVELRHLDSSMNDVTDSNCQSIENYFYHIIHSGDLYLPLKESLQLLSYDIASSELSQVLSSTDNESLKKWAMWSLAFSISKNPRVLAMVPNDVANHENTSDFADYLNYMGISIQNGSPHANALFSAYENATIADRTQAVDRIYLSFSGRPLLEEEDMWVETTDEAIADVFIDASRILLLLVYLHNASLAPDPNDSAEVKEFLENYNEDYFVGPAKSDEFAVEYVKEEKSLICLEQTRGTKMILYLHMSEAFWKVYTVNSAHIRSMWASQAMEQTFFAYADEERLSIQSTGIHLHNLINQAADMPIGYPALVSPICTSFVNIW